MLIAGYRFLNLELQRLHRVVHKAKKAHADIEGRASCAFATRLNLSRNDGGRNRKVSLCFVLQFYKKDVT